MIACCDSDDRVGAHIGDVPVLVERLRDAHGVARREAELARGLLLQRRGRERRGRAARVRLGLDAGDAAGDRVAAERGGERVRRRLVEHDRLALQLAGVVEVAAGGDPLAADAHEPRLEAGMPLGANLARAGPSTRRDEGESLALAVDHEARRRGLHAAGRQARADLAPEHGRDLVPVEAVEDAAGLLRVDECGVESRVLSFACLDRVLGDLVEDHAAHGHLGLQLLQRCHAMASPSRSSSVASRSSSASFSARLSSATVFFLESETT